MGKTTVATKLLKKMSYLEPVFSFYIMGYCRNIVVQPGKISRRGPALFDDVSFEGNKQIMILRWLHTAYFIPLQSYYANRGPYILHTGPLKLTFEWCLLVMCLCVQNPVFLLLLWILLPPLSITLLQVQNNVQKKMQCRNSPNYLWYTT